MKVICIDDSERSADIPLSKWVRRNQTYTVLKVEFMHQQGIYGCILEEIEGDFPYTHFACNRFRELTPEEVEQLESHLELQL